MSEGHHNEVWNDIPQFVGVYQASNLGRIRRLAGYGCKETRVIKQRISKGDRCGYPLVKLSYRGVHKFWRVHRLVAYAFYGMQVDGMVVHHVDSNRTNNLLKNLELVTGRLNTQLAHSKRMAEKRIAHLVNDLHWEY